MYKPLPNITSPNYTFRGVAVSVPEGEDSPEGGSPEGGGSGEPSPPEDETTGEDTETKVAEESSTDQPTGSSSEKEALPAIPADEAETGQEATAEGIAENAADPPSSVHVEPARVPPPPLKAPKVRIEERQVLHMVFDTLPHQQEKDDAQMLIYFLKNVEAVDAASKGPAETSQIMNESFEHGVMSGSSLFVMKQLIGEYLCI